MVYHDVMASWTKTMHFISGSNRLMERLNVFGGGRKKAAASEERLVAEIEALERQVRCCVVWFGVSRPRRVGGAGNEVGGGNPRAGSS